MMSSSFLEITCDGCSFSGSSLPTIGRFFWSQNGNFFPIDQQMGLCEDCADIIAMESFPGLKVIERAKEIHPIYLLGKPFMRHIEDDEAKYIASQNSLEILDSVIALDRPPVCLECGGATVHQITIPEGAHGDTAIDLGIKHFGCKGRLKIQGSGMTRIGFHSARRHYDLKGKLIETIEDDLNVDDYVITPRQRKNMMSKMKSNPNKPEKRTMSPKLRVFLDTDFK